MQPFSPYEQDCLTAQAEIVKASTPIVDPLHEWVKLELSSKGLGFLSGPGAGAYDR